MVNFVFSVTHLALSSSVMVNNDPSVKSFGLCSLLSQGAR